MNRQLLVIVVPLTACGVELEPATSVETSASLATPLDGQMLGASMATGDFDGDGFEDLAVGAPGYLFDNDVGRVYLYKGSIFGLVPWRVIEEAELNPNAAGGDEFGFALAATDFDGDGKDDLAIGSPGSRAPNGTAHGGVVFVMFGRSDGLVDASRLALDQSSSTGGSISEAGDRFGAAIAVGDLDGDGRPDLAVGAPGERTGSDKSPTGYVNTFVFRNRSFMNNHGIAVPSDRRWGSLQFGGALAIADFDRDGFGDVVVVTTAEGTPYTTAYLYRGAQFSFAPAIDLFPGQWPQFLHGSLAVGNFDGATYAGTNRKKPELAISEPQGSLIRIFRPDVHSSGLVMTPLPTIDATTLPLGSSFPGGACGASMVARDVDGDGFDDLVAGCPYATASAQPTQAGAIALFRGRPSGLVFKQIIDWFVFADGGDFHGVSGLDNLGASVAVGNFMGFNVPQIVGGMPGVSEFSSEDGAVGVFMNQGDNTFFIGSYFDQFSE